MPKTQGSQLELQIYSKFRGSRTPVIPRRSSWCSNPCLKPWTAGSHTLSNRLGPWKRQSSPWKSTALPRTTWKDFCRSWGLPYRTAMTTKRSSGRTLPTKRIRWFNAFTAWALRCSSEPKRTRGSCPASWRRRDSASWSKPCWEQQHQRLSGHNVGSPWASSFTAVLLPTTYLGMLSVSLQSETIVQFAAKGRDSSWDLFMLPCFLLFLLA